MAELGGIAAIVISLLLVAQELRQSQTIARAELAMALHEAHSILELQEMDPEFSRVWLKSRAEPENLTLQEQHQVHAFLAMALRRLSREFYNYQLGIFGEWKEAVSVYAPIYLGSDYGRAYWDEVRTVYLAVDDLTEFVEEIDTALENKETVEFFQGFKPRLMQKVQQQRQTDQ